MFYERFITLCKAKNVRPTAVAEAIGLSRTNASFWKKGSVPSTTNIQKLADYFGVPIDYLIETNKTASTNTYDIQELISDAELEAGKIMLDELIKAMEIIPKQYRPAAIHDMTTIRNWKKSVICFLMVTLQQRYAFLYTELFSSYGNG